MQLKINFPLITNMVVLIALISSGIGLFFVRAKKNPRIPDLELEIRAHEASQTIISGQYLILLNKNQAQDLEKILKPLDLEPILPLLNWTLVAKKNSQNFTAIPISSPDADEDQLILNSLLQLPSVLDAQHNFVLEAADIPDNQEFIEDWHLQSRSAQKAGLNMPKAWEFSTGSPKVRVAVIDDFISHHSFTFASRFKNCLSRVTLFEPFGRPEPSTSSSGHAELMLLALGACNNQPKLSLGMDSQANLMAIQRPSMGHAQTMAAALYASAINICERSLIACPKGLTLSMPKKSDIILLPFANNASDLLQFFSDMLEAINQENIIVVASAGNNHASSSNFFPGRAPGLINVGALNKHGKRAHFSNWGPDTDMLAPGEGINFIYPNLHKTAAGTSLSAAYVAGSISLMKAINPSLSWKSARYFLTSEAPPLNCEDYCLNEESSSSKIGCATLCCASTENRCGSLAVDTGRALELARGNQINAGLLELDHYYLIFTRNISSSQEVLVHNIGDVDARVETQVYDDNILVAPATFSLSSRSNASSEMPVAISFKKEPYKRQTFKVEFIVKNKNIIEDRAELFIEYIPKNSFGK